MRNALILLPLIVGALVARPPHVSAQSGSLEGPSVLEQQPAGWVFTPSIATGSTWDDNLLLTDPNEVPLQDYAASLGPALNLTYRGRRTEFTTGYENSALLYRQVDELNSTQQWVEARLRYRATRQVTVFAHGSFTAAPTTDSLDLGGVPFYRVGTRTTSTTAGVEGTVARHTFLDAGYTLGTVAFESDPRLETDLQGGYAHEGRVALARALTSRWRLGGQYDIRRAVLDDEADRFNIQSAAMTVEHRITPTTFASGFLGVAILGASVRHDSRVGPTVGLTMTRRMPLGTLTGGYQRTFIPSWGFGGTSQNEEWLMNVRVPLARNRAHAEGRATYMDADPIEVDQPGVRSLWLTLTLGYRVTRWLSAETYYHGTGQIMSQPGGDRRRNIIGLRLVAAKPMKLG